MKACTNLREEMKADLLKVYRLLNKTGRYRNQKECYEAVVQHAAPRFYMDVRWAHQRVSPLLHGDRSGLEKMSALQRAQYEDLFGVVVRLSRKEKFLGASLHDILRYAVQEPAKRFYISAARMGQIWREKKRERVEKLKA